MIGAVIVMASTVHTAAVDAATRKAILDAARIPVEARLATKVRFKVEELTRVGDDVFIRALMLDPHGAPLSFAATPLAGAADAGAVSHVYAALLRRAGDTWTVIAIAIGPTDVAWAGWSQRYGVSPALFAS